MTKLETLICFLRLITTRANIIWRSFSITMCSKPCFFNFNRSRSILISSILWPKSLCILTWPYSWIYILFGSICCYTILTSLALRSTLNKYFLLMSAHSWAAFGWLGFDNFVWYTRANCPPRIRSTHSSYLLLYLLLHHTRACCLILRLDTRSWSFCIRRLSQLFFQHSILVWLHI